MMRVNMKHVVEIAGGLVVGSLASNMLNGIAKVVKEKVKKIKENKKEKGES